MTGDTRVNKLALAFHADCAGLGLNPSTPCPGDYDMAEQFLERCATVGLVVVDPRAGVTVEPPRDES